MFLSNHTYTTQSLRNKQQIKCWKYSDLNSEFGAEISVLIAWNFKFHTTGFTMHYVYMYINIEVLHKLKINSISESEHKYCPYIYSVWHGLKKYWCSRNSFCVCHESMSQTELQQRQYITIYRCDQEIISVVKCNLIGWLVFIRPIYTIHMVSCFSLQYDDITIRILRMMLSKYHSTSHLIPIFTLQIV